MPDPNSFDPDASLEAYTVDRFCAAFGLGRTFVYDQIKTRKLRAISCANSEFDALAITRRMLLCDRISLSKGCPSTRCTQA